MAQPEPNTPATQPDFMQAIQRCAGAWHQVRAELPSNPGYHADQDNRNKAALAFLAQLPVLSGPASFQLYIACIAQGVAIGAVDPVDIGRFCHLAQTASSAWKLAHLTVPAAQRKEQKEAAIQAEKEAKQAEKEAIQAEKEAKQAEKEAAMQAEKEAKQAHPLPTKGNHPPAAAAPWEDGQDRQAARQLPDRKTQKELYKALRDRGIPVPSEIDLRNNPLVALYFCDLALNHLGQLPPPNPNSAPQPNPHPPQPNPHPPQPNPHPPQPNPQSSQPGPQSPQPGPQSPPQPPQEA
jgi:hypothetical protein